MTPLELGCESRLSRKTAYRRRYVDCVALSRTGSRQPIYDGDWEAQYGIPKGAKELQELVANHHGWHLLWLQRERIRRWHSEPGLSRAWTAASAVTWWSNFL